MGYDAHGLAGKIETAMGDARFTGLLREAFGENQDAPGIFFQSAPREGGPHLIIDVVGAAPVPDFGEADMTQQFEYEVYATMEDNLHNNPRASEARPNQEDGSSYESLQKEIAKYMRAVQLFFSTKLMPDDGFALLNISTISSGTFENPEGISVARSVLQMQLIA